MNIYTPNEIVALPLTTREEEHHSREREGRHVFISRYFHEYNQLNLNEKIALFETDENSVDSLDTVKVPPVWDVMARASTVWASLDVEVKQGWENRTIMLNDRPVPGLYQVPPVELARPTSEYHICQGLLYDLRNFKRIMKPVVTYTPRKGAGKRHFKFGKETFELKTQKYKSGYLFHYNLRMCIFGPQMDRIHLSERTYIQKKLNVIHLYSARRVNELFTHAGLATLSYVAHGRKHTTCAKVFFKSSTRNVNTTGYIVDETDNNWTVQLVNNTTVVTKRAVFERKSSTYQFLHDLNSEWSITEVWPVRIQINMESGKAEVTLVRFCIDLHTNLINFNHST